jgi:flagellar biosynthesis protein FlhB
MSIFTAIGAALVLLFYWLSGNGFARVLMFVVLAVLTGIGVGAMFSAIVVTGQQPGIFIVGAISGVALAWPLAGIPIYYQRHQYNKWLRMT